MSGPVAAVPFASPAEARRIVAFRLDGLGDLLMTTPALRALATTRPDVRLTLVTSPVAEPAARLLPFVDEVLVYDAPWVKATAPKPDVQGDLRFLGRLMAGAFDLAVVFTVETQSALPTALAAYLAGIPARLAYSRENPYQLLTHRLHERAPDEPQPHEVLRALRLVEHGGFRRDGTHLSLRVPPDAMRRVRRILGSLGLAPSHGAGPRRPWAVLHPGASAPSRRYPPERLAEAARLLAARGWGIVVAGGPGDVEAADLVARAGAGTSLAGWLDLGELAALLAVAPVAIANNSGPMHVAAAMGTPLVALYAQTNAQHTPWEVPTWLLTRAVPCAGCLKSVCPLGTNACLAPVEPAEIVAAAQSLLGRGVLPLAASGVQGAPAGAAVGAQRPVAHDGLPLSPAGGPR